MSRFYYLAYAGSDKCDVAVEQGLPVQFCKTHLPNRDATINLVDENDEISETKYLAQKTGLSAGWRGFSIDHELVDGDALVFQLIDPASFKVILHCSFQPHIS